MQFTRAVAMQDDNPSNPNRSRRLRVVEPFYNGTGSTIAASVPLATDTTDYSSAGVLLGEACKPGGATSAGPDCVIVGFNLEACPTGTWGWRVVRGTVTEVPCETDLNTVGELVVGSTSTAGKVMAIPASYAVTTRVVGKNLTVASSGTCTVDVFIA